MFEPCPPIFLSLRAGCGHDIMELLEAAREIKGNAADKKRSRSAFK